MKIENIMSTPVVTADIDDSLLTIKEIFDNCNFHHVLILNSGILVGVISDRDLLKAISPNIGTMAETSKDAASLNKKAHQIMSREPVAVEKDATIVSTIDIFMAHDISCIPVINDEDEPVGIISWRDILGAVLHHSKNSK